jgi:hypothetical protein
MSQQAVDILNRWMAEALQPVPRAEIPKEAARLAVEFSAYADDAGLNLEELQIDLGEDLVSHMAEALEAAAEAEAGSLLVDDE